MEQYLLPKRVVTYSGNIINIDNLFINKEKQIGLNEPVTTIMKDDSSILLDFGKEICGGGRILVCNYNNKPINLLVRFGESVSESLACVGEKNATNDHAVREMTIQTTNLCDIKFGNTGFRFLYIKKLTTEIDLIIKNIYALSIYNNKNIIGSFNCDDELINNIYEASSYTVSLCVQNDYVWDGVKRDRLVWIGDLHPEFLSLSCMYDDLKEIKNSLDFVCKQTPLPGWMNSIPMYSMWWIIILNDYYNKTKDSEFVLKHKIYIIDLLKQICLNVDASGKTIFPMNFLDWPSSDSPDLVAGVHALTIICLKKALKVLEVLNDTSINDDVKQKLDLLLGYKYQIDSKKQVVALNAIARCDYNNDTYEKLTENGSNGFSTFMSYYILKALFNSGGKDESISLMKEYYGAMLDLGATTFWEDFDISWKEGCYRIDEIPNDKKDIHGDFGKYCYQGFRHSLCHGWSSGPVAFLTEFIAGIKISEEDDKKIFINPYLGSLNYVECSYPTKYGLIKVCHKKDNNGLIITTFEKPEEIEIICK